MSDGDVTLTYQGMLEAKKAGESIEQIANRLGVGQTTVYRVLSEKADRTVAPRKRAHAGPAATPPAAPPPQPQPLPAPSRPGAIRVSYRAIAAEQAAGTSWARMAEQWGVSVSYLQMIKRDRLDREVMPRGKTGPRASKKVLRPKAAAAKNGVSLAAVNKALAHNPQGSALAAAEEFAQTLRQLGVQRITIDLEKGTVEMATVDRFSLPTVER